MFSSSRTSLRALFLAASSSLVLSIPLGSDDTTLASRSFTDYVDNLIYLDANKTGLWSALSYSGETYAAYLDNKWDGLLLQKTWGGNSSTTHNIRIGDFVIEVEDFRKEVGVLEDDIEVEFFAASQWPAGMPQINMKDIANSYMGIDINNGMSPIYSVFAAKWPQDYSKWFYDILLTYDWMNSSSSTGPDFGGIIVTGKALSLAELGIPTSAGIPDLSTIASQPPIPLNTEGTINLDNKFIANGNQVSFTSQVPKTASGKVVADVDYSRRWSMFPDEIVHALYGGFPGAKYTGESTFGFWTIDCGSQVSFSFSIDGKKYEFAEDALVAPNPWGDKCIGSIFTKGQAVSAVPEFDIIIGFQAMSSFYFRAGINTDNNTPYYKFLQMPVSGLNVTGSGTNTNLPVTYTAGSGTLAVTATGTKTGTLAPTAQGTTTAVAGQQTGTASEASHHWSSGSTAEPTGNGANKAAANLAELGDDDDSSTDFWRKRAQLFEYIMIGLAALSGILLLSLIGLFVKRAKDKRSMARPSAYRTLHEAETHEGKAGLYDSEGGRSRYADPYSDTTH